MSIGDCYTYTANKTHSYKQPTLIFVHGATMEHSVWLLQSRYFAHHGYNVAAIDLPAHGLSGGEPLTSIENMAGWLNQLITQLEGSEVHLIGHSMGALIALETAATYQHTIPLKSIALLGFSYPMNVNDTLLNAAKNEPHKAYSMMTQFSNYSKIGGEPNPGFWSPGMQISMMENAGNSLVFHDLNACNNYGGGEQALNAINIPTLVLSGLDDKMAPAKLANKMADAYTHANFIGIQQCGHSLLAEKPNEVRSILAQHFANSTSI